MNDTLVMDVATGETVARPFTVQERAAHEHLRSAFAWMTEVAN